jgi:formate hydrogenlyase subunit 3/multisubunit Na+/H+ antiporter MnhD subunit
MTNTWDMTKMGGLSEKLPVVILATLAGFLTIDGVPPAVGFNASARATILAGSLATLIILGYEFKAIWTIFYGNFPENLKEIKNVPFKMAITLLALGSLAIIFGIWPALITNSIEGVHLTSLSPLILWMRGLHILSFDFNRISFINLSS